MYLKYDSMKEKAYFVITWYPCQQTYSDFLFQGQQIQYKNITNYVELLWYNVNFVLQFTEENKYDQYKRIDYL